MDIEKSNLEKIAELTAKLILAVSDINSLFNTNTLLLAETNLEGYFVRVSRGWIDLFGFTREEIIQQPWLNFVHPEDIQPTLDVFDKMKAGEAIECFSNRYRCADGTYKTLLWRASGLDELEKANNVGTLFCSAIDITNQ